MKWFLKLPKMDDTASSYKYKRISPAEAELQSLKQQTWKTRVSCTPDPQIVSFQRNFFPSIKLFITNQPIFQLEYILVACLGML